MPKLNVLFVLWFIVVNYYNYGTIYYYYYVCYKYLFTPMMYSSRPGLVLEVPRSQFLWPWPWDVCLALKPALAVFWHHLQM